MTEKHVRNDSAERRHERSEEILQFVKSLDLADEILLLLALEAKGLVPADSIFRILPFGVGEAYAAGDAKT